MITIFVSNYGMVLELQGIRRCIRGGKKLISASEDAPRTPEGCFLHRTPSSLRISLIILINVISNILITDE